MTMSAFDPWSYRPDTGYSTGLDLVGYKIAAIDGDIGKVDQATYDVGTSSLVIDTGPWIFGRKVMLPAGVVDRVDTDERKVYVDRTKDQIKDAPSTTRTPESTMITGLALAAITASSTGRTTTDPFCQGQRKPSARVQIRATWTPGLSCEGSEPCRSRLVGEGPGGGPGPCRSAGRLSTAVVGCSSGVCQVSVRRQAP